MLIDTNGTTYSRKVGSATTAMSEFILRRRRSAFSIFRASRSLGRVAEGYERTTQITTLILALAQRYATVPRFHLAYRLSRVVRLLTHLHRVRNTAFVSGQFSVEERSIANALHAGDSPMSDQMGSEQTHRTDLRRALQLSAGRAPISLRLTTVISCRVVHLHTTSTDDEVNRARERGRVQGRRQ